LSRIFKASVKENRQLTNRHYLLTLHPLEKIKKPIPGQFFMISAGSSLDPLLRRPFSLYRNLGHDIQILYMVVGKLTGILKDKKTDDILELVGPLGNGFPTIKGKHKPVLVGGGLGSVPLIALAESTPKKKPLFFIGARTKKELLYIDALKSIHINPVVTTEDGTLGKKGLITGELENFLTRHASNGDAYCFYACGPRPMLREMSILAKRFNVKGYITLEENM
jgi:dihydroorotate dehydrogenase electron transfer subunit